MSSLPKSNPFAKTIIVDVDAVCADIHHQWLRRYNQDHQDTLSVDTISDWDMTRFVKPACGRKIFGYLDDPTLYDAMPPIPGSLEGVAALRAAGWRVIFCTAAPLGSAGRKLTWLRDHGFLPKRPGVTFDSSPSPDYFEGSDKSMIRGDIIIDDYLETLKNFPGIAIAFAQPWNVEAPNFGIARATDWPDVVRQVQAIDAN